MNMVDTFEMVLERRQQLEEECKAARQMAEWYTARANMLDELLHWADRAEVISTTNPLPYPGDTGQDRAGTVDVRRKRKTNAQMYEEVLLEHGKPMHLVDLLDKALARGLQQQGTGTPEDQLRNALNSARKRFYNVGNNVWWVVGRPEPEDLPTASGGEPSPNGQGDSLIPVAEANNVPTHTDETNGLTVARSGWAAELLQ